MRVESDLDQWNRAEGLETGGGDFAISKPTLDTCRPERL